MNKNKPAFSELINKGYNPQGAFITLGAPLFENEVLPEIPIKLALKTFNRHGLIAGATGTGKTKTLQVLAESLSEQGIPALLMDIKGDLSGLGVSGLTSPALEDRAKQIGIPFKTSAFPIEFLSLSNEKGAKLRATVSEFGPVLFSKILGINDTQSSIISILFKYCDDHALPLLDLKDFKKVLQFISEEGRASIEKDYGKISTASTGTILRKVIELEQQGGETFFGEYSFETEDLIRKDADGKGILSIIRLTDIQDKPMLFSTFMLCLLAEIYHTFPEQGDQDKPKLVIFIDEAHLLFEEASKALLDQLETIIKLIRSKGVGVFFCTQTPTDIPADILGQLGLKIQHALRAFTAKDRKSIKLTAENYPLSDFYETEELITALGIGEALVTALDEKGSPTPLAAVRMKAPASRMNILNTSEIDQIISQSKLISKYNQIIDRESAYEILCDRLEHKATSKESKIESEEEKPARKPAAPKPEKSTLEKAMDSPIAKQVGRTVARELTRGLLGVLGISTSKKRSKSWF
jgi:DNA helicase HerA-like ATPase